MQRRQSLFVVYVCYHPLSLARVSQSARRRMAVCMYICYRVYDVVTAAAGLSRSQTHGLATGRLARITRRRLSGSSPELSVDDLLNLSSPALQLHASLSLPVRLYVTTPLLGLPSAAFCSLPPLASSALHRLPVLHPKTATLASIHHLTRPLVLHVDLTCTPAQSSFPLPALLFRHPIGALGLRPPSIHAQRPASISDPVSADTSAALDLALSAPAQS